MWCRTIFKMYKFLVIKRLLQNHLHFKTNIFIIYLFAPKSNNIFSKIFREIILKSTKNFENRKKFLKKNKKISATTQLF